MLACRLCLAFGEQDPEQWLENCPRRVLNVWSAFAEAEGWFTQKRLAAITAVSLKRLVALKYNQDSVAEVLEGIEEMANKYMPQDAQWTKDTKPIDESVLKAMDRGGTLTETPRQSVTIDMEDPWK